MIHQDLITWFDSSVNVDETYIEGRPCLDDLTWFDSSVNVDETYIEGRPCLDNLIRSGRPHQAWTRLSQGSTSGGEGTTWLSWYSTSHEPLFQDEFTFCGRLLKDELDLSLTHRTNIPFCQNVDWVNEREIVFTFLPWYSIEAIPCYGPAIETFFYLKSYGPKWKTLDHDQHSNHDKAKK